MLDKEQYKKIDKFLSAFLGQDQKQVDMVVQIVFRTVTEWVGGIGGYGPGDVITLLDVVRDLARKKANPDMPLQDKKKLNTRMIIKLGAALTPGLPSAWVGPVANRFFR